MGRAINKAVTIAEILKRKMPLHQMNRLTSSEIIDIFEPLEEGLDVVESKRYVSCMTITLSSAEDGIDMGDIGYQVGRDLIELHNVGHGKHFEITSSYCNFFYSPHFHLKNQENSNEFDTNSFAYGDCDRYKVHSHFMEHSSINHYSNRCDTKEIVIRVANQSCSRS